MKKQTSSYDLFLKYKVDADSVEDFLNKYHKQSRYTGRGREYAEWLLKSYEEEFKKNGFCFMTHHNSITGRTVAYYG